MMQHFIETAIANFRTYKMLGEKAINQIDPTKIASQPCDHANSLNVIVRHLHGNMLSRWTEIFTTDGEKPNRDRDSEFIEPSWSFPEMMQHWEEGWNRLLSTLQTLSAEDYHKKLLIRSEPHSLVEAISRQLSHYAYHVGQIIMVCQIYSTDSWKSLSIPKGKSDEFNQKMSEPRNK